MAKKHFKTVQRLLLLERLRKGACTTFEARHQLDIIGVAPRIFELRHHEGFNIQTHWSYDVNPGGGRHRIASYVLIPGRWKGGKENVL